MRTIVKIIENGKIALVRETAAGKLLGYRKQVAANGRYFPGLRIPPVRRFKDLKFVFVGRLPSGSDRGEVSSKYPTTSSRPTKVYVLMDTQENEPVQVSLNPSFEENLKTFLLIEGDWKRPGYYVDDGGKSYTGEEAFNRGFLKGEFKLIAKQLIWPAPMARYLANPILRCF